jgi:hypothetical protein
MIRNKKYIDRVIDLDVTNSGADAKHYLNVYHGRLMESTLLDFLFNIEKKARIVPKLHC